MDKLRIPKSDRNIRIHKLLNQWETYNEGNINNLKTRKQLNALDRLVFGTKILI